MNVLLNYETMQEGREKNMRRVWRACPQCMCSAGLKKGGPMNSRAFFAAKWIFSFSVPFIVYFAIPASPTLTPPMIMFLAVTLWAVACWALDSLNDVAVAFLLPVFYVIFCQVPSKVVYAPWTSEIPMIVIGGFIVGRIMLESGLGARVALWCIHVMGGTLNGALCGLTIAVVIVSPFVPSLLGKSAIFLVIAASLCEALDFKPKSREATAVVLTACLAVASTKLCFMTSAADNLMGMVMTDAISGVKTSWAQYALHNVPTNLVYVAMTLGLIMLLLPTKSDKVALRATVQQKYAELGPMSLEQKKTAILLIVTILLLMTDSIHGINIGFVLIVVAMAGFLPGVGLLDKGRLERTNFVPLFFIVGCMCIGAAGGYLKVTTWFAANAFPYFEGVGNTGGAVGAYMMGAGANFLLTPLACVTTLVSPLAELSMKLGLNPNTMYYSFMYGLDNYLFPYEYAVILFFFSSGYINFADMIKVFAVRMVCTGFFIAFVGVPYWTWITS